MMNAPAHNSPGPLQRTALRSCGCHTKEFDPGAAPIFRTSTIKTLVTSLESHHLQTPTALSPRNLFRTLMGLEKLTARIKKKIIIINSLPTSFGNRRGLLFSSPKNGEWYNCKNTKLRERRENIFCYHKHSVHFDLLYVRTLCKELKIGAIKNLAEYYSSSRANGCLGYLQLIINPCHKKTITMSNSGSCTNSLFKRQSSHATNEQEHTAASQLHGILPSYSTNDCTDTCNLQNEFPPRKMKTVPEHNLGQLPIPEVQTAISYHLPFPYYFAHDISQTARWAIHPVYSKVDSREPE